MPPPPHLDPSALGTKAYWDTAYTTELTNYTANPSDEGTIWFSDADAESRMLSFLESLADEASLHKTPSSSSSDDNDNDSETTTKTASRFLDLGTGNGHLLFALREEDWQGEMCGVDYSSQSVQLAREICRAKLLDVQFEIWDILHSEPAAEWLKDGFDVVLDKGTFDAICLSNETDAAGRRVCEGYRERVERLVKKGGRFLVTSCNWTAEELRGWFEVEGGGFVWEEQVRYPGFTFGGKTGTKVATLCFRKR